MKFLACFAALVTITKAFSPTNVIKHVHSSSVANRPLSVSHLSNGFTATTAGRTWRRMNMSLNDEDESTNVTPTNDDDAKMANKVKGRKKRVLMGYRLSSILYVCTTLRLLLSKVSRATTLPFFIIYVATGPLLASGLTYILAGAAENDRLKSDTYKRLNLLTACFGCLGLVTYRKLFNSSKLFLITYLISMINSIKGYGYGVRGWTLREGNSSAYVEDILQGTKNSFQTFFGSITNVKSAGYLLGTTLVKALALSKLIEIVNLTIQGGGAVLSSPLVLSRVYRLSKLALVSGIMFTLKDAADRDRLNGTTFIQLNFLASFFWLSMAGYIIESGAIANDVMVKVIAAVSLFFTGFTASNGVTSIMEKKK